MAEYSAVAIQTVATNSNVLLSNGSRCCKKGYVEHRDDSGVFFLKGITNQCRVTYKVSFGANIAIATGGTVEPISIALTINGEPLGNATAIVTPATIATDYFNVFVSTFIDVPYGCCATISVENTSATTDIDVQNANLIIERVC